MLNILCSSYSFPSGRILKNLIEQATGERVRLTSYPERLKSSPKIRYGNSGGNFKEDTTLNSPDFIRVCSSKLAFSNLLVNNMHTPIYKKGTKDLDSVEYPVLIRRTLSASGGKGIVLCKNREEFNAQYRGEFWTPYIFTDFELRVHVLGGKIARIFRKDPMESTEFLIRNNDTCHFSIRDIQNYPKLSATIDTLNDLFTKGGFTFGFYALDIGWDKKKKEYFIFEANSAPGLNEHTAELYSNFLIENL